MSKNVLVVGSINADYVIQTERVPVMGETLTGSGFSVNLGGKGANQAVAIAKLGSSVKMLGAVGRDQTGDLCIQNLASFGIDCSAVLRTDIAADVVAEQRGGVDGKQNHSRIIRQVQPQTSIVFGVQCFHGCCCSI